MLIVFFDELKTNKIFKIQVRGVGATPSSVGHIWITKGSEEQSSTIKQQIYEEYFDEILFPSIFTSIKQAQEDPRPNVDRVRYP
jgi:hypothetical protein